MSVFTTFYLHMINYVLSGPSIVRSWRRTVGVVSLVPRYLQTLNNQVNAHNAFFLLPKLLNFPCGNISMIIPPAYTKYIGGI